jgi:hypothetical protein
LARGATIQFADGSDPLTRDLVKVCPTRSNVALKRAASTKVQAYLVLAARD